MHFLHMRRILVAKKRGGLRKTNPLRGYLQSGTFEEHYTRVNSLSEKQLEELLQLARTMGHDPLTTKYAHEDLMQACAHALLKKRLAQTK